MSVWLSQRLQDVNSGTLVNASLYHKTPATDGRSGTFENEVLSNENYTAAWPHIYIYILVGDFLTFESWRPVLLTGG